MKKRIISTLLIIVFAFSIPLFAQGADTSNALKDTAKVLKENVQNPIVGSEGGEWAVLGLARSGCDVPQSFYEQYYKNVEKVVKEQKGVLHDRKYTEYSRVIIGLTAAGYDPQNVVGYDLTLPLGDFENTIWQGINGPIFALIALDCGNYEIPVNNTAKTQATREMYLDEILSRQLNDGGFSLSGGTSETTMNEKSDPDLTSMALQALANYQQYPIVARATEKALVCLSNMQDGDGGFASWGKENSENVAQAIVALCEMGISIDDERFVKNGKSLLDNLMTYYKKGEGFMHTSDGTGHNQMATEQAFYALAAIQRMNDGKSSLYNMSFVTPEKMFKDITNHANRTAIETLASRGIVRGKGNNLFAPDDTITRAEFATIVVNALGFAPIKMEKFTDVPENEWYAGTVGAAFKNGIVSGTSETTFTPLGLLNRSEAAVMVAKAAKLCEMDTAMTENETRDILTQFGDYMMAPEWAWDSLAFCYREGILSIEEVDINPTEKITRAEIAEMLFRMLGKSRLLL